MPELGSTAGSGTTTTITTTAAGNKLAVGPEISATSKMTATFKRFVPSILPPKKRGRYDEFNASSFGFDAQAFARKEANWLNSAPMDNLLALPNLKKKYHYMDFERGCTVFDDSYVQVSSRLALSPSPRPSPGRKGSKISLERGREAGRQRRERREQERLKREVEREVCRREMHLSEEYYHRQSAAETDTQSDCHLELSIAVRKKPVAETLAPATVAFRAITARRCAAGGQQAGGDV